jgi:hypothetical protein
MHDNTEPFKMDFVYYQSGSDKNFANFVSLEDLVKRKSLKRPRLEATSYDAQENQRLNQKQREDAFQSNNMLVLSPDWRYLTTVKKFMNEDSGLYVLTKIRENFTQKDLTQEQRDIHIHQKIYYNSMSDPAGIRDDQLSPPSLPQSLYIDRESNKIIDVNAASISDRIGPFDGYTLTDETGVYTNDLVPEAFKNDYHYNYNHPDNAHNAHFETLPNVSDEVVIPDHFHLLYVRASEEKDFVDLVTFLIEEQKNGIPNIKNSIDGVLLIDSNKNETLTTPHGMRGSVKFSNGYLNALKSENPKSIIYSRNDIEETASEVDFFNNILEPFFFKQL